MHDLRARSRIIYRSGFSYYLIAATFLLLVTGTYAYRQRAWALKLKAQLELTNKDDVKLMHLLTREQKQDVIHRFRDQGETRIADWIDQQYLKGN